MKSSLNKYGKIRKVCVECQRLLEAYLDLEANYTTLVQERERANKRGILTLIEDLDQLIANATEQRRLAFQALLDHEAIHSMKSQEN